MASETPHARYARRKYQAKKLAGICVQSGCNEQVDGSVLCPTHSKRRNDRMAAYKSSPKVTHQRWLRVKAKRAKRREAGLCMGCNQPAARAGWCTKHYAKVHGYQERYWRKSHGPMKGSCGRCGTKGKRKDYCDCRFRHEAGIDEFARARSAA